MTVHRSLKAARSVRAFTLFELILAMAIAAILAASLYASFSTAIRAKRSAMAAIEPLRNVSIAADIMARDFGNATSANGILRGTFTGTHQAGDGSGDADSVEFHTIGADEPLQQDDPLSEGIRRVQFVLRTDLNPPSVVRRVTRNLLSTSDPIVNEEIICRDVKSFSLRYYDAFSWIDSFDSTQYNDSIPMAVQMTMELNPPLDVIGQDAVGPKMTRIFPLACARQNDLISGASGTQ